MKDIFIGFIIEIRVDNVLWTNRNQNQISKTRDKWNKERKEKERE